MKIIRSTAAAENEPCKDCPLSAYRSPRLCCPKSCGACPTTTNIEEVTEGAYECAFAKECKRGCSCRFSSTIAFPPCTDFDIWKVKGNGNGQELASKYDAEHHTEDLVAKMDKWDICKLADAQIVGRGHSGKVEARRKLEDDYGCAFNKVCHSGCECVSTAVAFEAVTCLVERFDIEPFSDFSAK